MILIASSKYLLKIASLIEKNLDKLALAESIDNGKPLKLAKTVEEVLDMPETEYADYRQRCRGFVEEKYDIKENINAWIELYNDL